MKSLSNSSLNKINNNCLNLILGILFIILFILVFYMLLYNLYSFYNYQPRFTPNFLNDNKNIDYKISKLILPNGCKCENYQNIDKVSSKDLDKELNLNAMLGEDPTFYISSVRLRDYQDMLSLTDSQSI